MTYLLASHVWRQDHNGFTHQDSGFIDHVVQAEVVVFTFPRRQLPIVGDGPLPAQLPLRQHRDPGQAPGAAVVAEILSKRLELLHSFVPKAASIAMLLNPNNPGAEAMSRDVAVMYEGAEITTIEGLLPTARCIRCSRRRHAVIGPAHNSPPSD